MQLAGRARLAFFYSGQYDIGNASALHRHKDAGVAVVYSVTESAEGERLGNDIGQCADTCCAVPHPHAYFITFPVVDRDRTYSV